MSSLELSAACDVVPADAVDIVARAVRFELASLEVELRRTSVETAELERSVDECYVVEPGEDVALERRVRVFLDDWQRHEEEQLREMIDAAQQRADSRLRLARIEGATIFDAARTEVEAWLLPAEPGLSLRLVPPSLPSPPREAILEARSASPVEAEPDEHVEGAPDDIDATAAALAQAVAAAFSDAIEPAPPAVQHQDVNDSADTSSWLDDALAALDLEDPNEALAAAAAAATSVTEETADAEFDRIVGHGEDGGPTIAEAEPQEVYARFWKGERDAVAARRRVRDWAPIEVLLPMLAVLVVLVLVGLWIG